MPWYKALLAGLSWRRSGFDSKLVNVEILVEGVALVHILFTEYFDFPLSLPMLHNYKSIHLSIIDAI